MNVHVSVAMLLACVVCVSPAFARTWTDSSEAFSVEAELVDFKDGKVSLKKTNGKIITVPLEKLSTADQRFVREQDAGDSPTRIRPGDLTGKPLELAHDDGKPDGRKSFPRGHAAGFEAPEGRWYLTSVRIHGSRDGHRAPPKEDFHITLCGEDFKKIADFAYPYKRFQKGPSKWVTLRTRPTEVPAKFVICADFNAERTKGVLVSHDAKGRSLVGRPGRPAGYFTGGDWLIRVKIDQLKSGGAKPGK